MLAGDGHGGDKTSSCLSRNSQLILRRTLDEGVDAGMAYCQDLCKEFADGAMLVICVYEFATRKLEIISVGDASCCVYQNNTLMHTQPHQDAEQFAQKYPEGTCAGVDLDGQQFGTVALKRNLQGAVELRGKLSPQPDGRTMLYPTKPTYMVFFIDGLSGFGGDDTRALFSPDVRLPNAYASGAFVGHKGYPRLPARKTQFVIPAGPFHIVMTSDGVSDVMHPEDALLRRRGLSALDILNECKTRWTAPMWTLNGQAGMKISRLPTTTKITSSGRVIKSYKKSGYKYQVKFHDGDQRTVTHIEESNKGADDISVLVYSGI